MSVIEGRLKAGLTPQQIEALGRAGPKVVKVSYTVDSDCMVDYRLDSAQEIAQALIAKWTMELRGGVVVANPVPQAFSMPRARIDSAIEQALQEAATRRISGKEVTPFLLGRVSELTGGDSLATNIELKLNHARLASEIAVQMAHQDGYHPFKAAPGTPVRRKDAYRESPDGGCARTGLGS